MKIDLKNSKSIAQWAAAFLFWVLILGCFMFSFRAAGTANQSQKYINNQMVSLEQAENLKLAEGLAKSFAVEWATFDGENPNNYQKRLGGFIHDYNIKPPGGFQECAQASVITIEEEDNLYRVKLLLHLKRVVEADVARSNPSSIITQEAVAHILSTGTNANTQEWQNISQCVVVTIEITDDQAMILGSPVVMPLPEFKEAGSLYSYERPENEFTTFAKQALEFYYSGKDMKNFTAPEVEIPALGGYELIEATVISFEVKNNEARAMLEATLTTPGLINFKQEIVLEASKINGNWALKRVGSW